jgi:hypothetical protein
MGLSYVMPGGNTINVAAGGDLQAALNSAQPGDEVVLQAGATYTGNFLLPVKSGASFITLRSSRCAELPTGVRVTPAQSALMARLATPNVAPVLTAPVRSHHWRVQCLEFTQGAAVGSWGYSLIDLGEGDVAGQQNTLDAVPHDLEFDRLLVRARDDRTAVQRGITLNSASTSITNSHISGIKWAGVDTQAVGGWNGPGPFLIENNYLEAAGENIIFGGAATAIPGLVPSDITITNNHLFKPLSWRIGDSSYAGTAWTVKNLLELKSARRVRVEGNTLENCWPHAQVGWGIIFNALGEYGPSAVIEDVTFSRNTMRNVSNGINLRGMEPTDPQTRMRRINISDNLVEGLGAFGGEGKAFQVLNGSEGVTFDHNTVRGTVYCAMVLESAPGFSHVGFAFRNNLMPHGPYGVFGAGGTFGTSTLDRYASGWAMAGNAMYAKPADPAASLYPAGNFFPATLTEAVGMIGTDNAPVGVRTTYGVAQNPVDDAQFFVRQHYADFLGREPDAAGLAFWTDEIKGCGTNTACVESKRSNVSAAFFLSIEFQNTGYLVERIYKVAYGDLTEVSTGLVVPIIRREEFTQDTPLISAGVAVGVGDWEAKLEANKVAYAQSFVQRQRFTDIYGALTPAQLVNKLNQNAGGVLTEAERAALTNALAANNSVAGRASVLREVAQNAELNRRERNRAFVLMQYFGYLRRNPNDAPEAGLNYAGWNFWLDKLNQFNGNYIEAEMARAFITSDEYRKRFGR